MRHHRKRAPGYRFPAQLYRSRAPLCIHPHREAMGTPHSHTLAALPPRPIGYDLALTHLSNPVLRGLAPGLYEPYNRRLRHQKRRTPILSPFSGLCLPWQRKIQNQNRIYRRRYSVNRTSIHAPDIPARITPGRHLAIIQIPHGHPLCCIRKLPASRHRNHLNL